jgi:hypothetical protein
MATRILVLYGGDEATAARNELLAWLRGPWVSMDARIVAEAPPNSEGAVDDRVDDAIAWADAAIAILTPDSRSPHGAPNVMDEIGRWRGGRGKATMLLLRRDDVQPYSNHLGLVYVGFKDRVTESFENIRHFLMSLPNPPDPDPPGSPAQTVARWKELVDSVNGKLTDTKLRWQRLSQLNDFVESVIPEFPGTTPGLGDVTKAILESRQVVDEYRTASAGLPDLVAKISRMSPTRERVATLENIESQLEHSLRNLAEISGILEPRAAALRGSIEALRKNRLPP